jgi:hypothetical protein
MRLASIKMEGEPVAPWDFDFESQDDLINASLAYRDFLLRHEFTMEEVLEFPFDPEIVPLLTMT